MITTIGKEYKFEAAHMLFGHKGACARLHGHSYKVKVELTGETLGGRDPLEKSSEGMVMDYGDLDNLVKHLIEQLDHKFLASNKDEIYFTPEGGSDTDENIRREEKAAGVVRLGFRVTAENLTAWFVKNLERRMPFNITGLVVIVKETEETFARVATAVNVKYSL